MNDLKTVDRAERKAIFIKAAFDIGIRPDMVEKDYWVSWTLNQLFADKKLGSIFLFKGGTSLSKAFHIIKRFSEDIDLLLDLGEVAENNESFEKKRSKNATNTFKSKIRKNTEIYIAECLQPRIEKIVGQYCTTEIPEDSPCDIYINYPGVFESDSYIRSYIKLEIGAFAQGTPFIPAHIRSYVSEKLPQLPESPVDIPTVSAVRTFWEKLTIIHYLNFLPEDRPTPPRHSRHFYDIFMMGKSPYKQNAIAHKDLLEKIIEFDRQFYPKHGVDYEIMCFRNLSLVPCPRLSRLLASDYEQMDEMIFGERPTWQEIIDYLAGLEKELAQI
ncbi:MAG TPA: hypothetical protein DE060_12455 [Lentisphaeria bacterium]|nr:hypothetical protein [Lentisphaeria bacterium]